MAVQAVICKSVLPIAICYWVWLKNMTSGVALCHPICRQRCKTISTYYISLEPALIYFKIEELKVWQKSAGLRVTQIL